MKKTNMKTTLDIRTEKFRASEEFREFVGKFPWEAAMKFCVIFQDRTFSVQKQSIQMNRKSENKHSWQEAKLTEQRTPN